MFLQQASYTPSFGGLGVSQFLRQGLAEPLSDGPVHLSLYQEGIDDRPAVVHGGIAEKAHRSSLWVHLNGYHMGSKGEWMARQGDTGFELQPRFCLGDGDLD